MAQWVVFWVIHNSRNSRFSLQESEEKPVLELRMGDSIGVLEVA